MKKFLSLISVSTVLLMASQSNAMSMFHNKEQHQSIADMAKANSENNQNIRSTQEGQSAPVSVTATGTNNAVNVNVVPSDAYKKAFDAVTHNSLDAKTNESDVRSNEIKVSKGMAIGFACFGLSLFIAAVVYFLKYTSFGRAADQGFATVIGLVESHLHTTTDTGNNALLGSVLNSLNKERGKLK